MSNGKLIIFSAPSGSGKTTVVNYLLKHVPDLAFSISATTRAKRPGEVDGKDYYFLSQQEFEKRLANNEFLEHEEVYHGLYYGTLKSEVDRIWSEGKHVIFDVDVKGGVNIKKTYGDKALAVFLRPPSIEVAMERLKKRATEVEHEMKERVDKAMFEMGFQEQFDVTIVNDVLEETFEKATAVVKDFINKP